MNDYIKQVTVTGDVSAIVNDQELLKVWCDEVAKEICEQKPEFAIIHIQGLHAAQNPNELAAMIDRNVFQDKYEIQKHFETSIAYFDTNCSGLGSIYLFHSHDEVKSYDRHSTIGYKQLRLGHQCDIGTQRSNESIITHRFSENRNPRINILQYNSHGSADADEQISGYMLARFRIYGRDFTFVNLSLHQVPFEDIDELIEQPEARKAELIRREQINHLLKELDSEGLKDDSILVAGAFNAQLYETALISDLAVTQRAKSYARKSSDGRIEGIEQRDRYGRSILTVEQHRFDLHSIHDWFFRLGRGQMVKKYNSELAEVVFSGKLSEESVFFQPSRHYGFDDSSPKESFIKHLCPSWSDRVLYNDKLNDLVRHDSFCASGLYYGLVAEKAHVGRFKPVALHATICLK